MQNKNNKHYIICSTFTFVIEILRTIFIHYSTPKISKLPAGSILVQDESPHSVIAFNNYMGRWYWGNSTKFAEPLDEAYQYHNDLFLYMGPYIKPIKVTIK
jgi:hypothetical protein